jgi:hypothetical protein
MKSPSAGAGDPAGFLTMEQGEPEEERLDLRNRKRLDWDPANIEQSKRKASQFAILAMLAISILAAAWLYLFT